MTYPLIPAENSTEDWVDKVLVSMARSGALRIRRLQPSKKRLFKLVHTLVTSAQKSSFEAFYDANRTAPFPLLWIGDGLVYNVMFVEGTYSFKPTVNLLWTINVQVQEA